MSEKDDNRSELDKIFDRLNATPDPDLEQQPWVAPSPSEWRNGDGTPMNWKQRAREHTSSFIYHAGWACVGQQCDCGHNPFNKLAARVDPWMNGPDAWEETDRDFVPVGWARKAAAAVGGWLMRLGQWVDSLEMGNNLEVTSKVRNAESNLPGTPPDGDDGVIERAKIDTLIKGFVPTINSPDFTMSDEELAIEAAAIDREIHAIIEANRTLKVKREGE